MKIAIYGAGGVGGYFGALLAQGGHDVIMIARGPHLDAMRRFGLHVKSPRGDVFIPAPECTDDPDAVGPVDAVLVAVKSADLAEVGERIGGLMGPETLVVPLLNGVDAHERLLPSVGRAHMGKGLTRIISKVAGPGRIEHVGVDPYIALSEWNGEASDRGRALVSALRRCGVQAEIPPDIDAAIWQKFLFVCSLGGVTAVCRAPIGAIRSTAGARRMLEGAMEEIRAVATARDVSLPPNVVSDTLDLVDGFPADGTTSLQRDIQDGRPSELEAWSGAAVRLGRDAGVPVPVHEFIYAALVPGERRALEEGAERSGSASQDAPMDGTPYEELSLHGDGRGFVVEPAGAVDMEGKANVHAVMTRPGGVRGNHFHRRGHEVMTVVGPARVRVRADGELSDVDVPAGKAYRFRFPPGVSHAVENTGDDWGLLVAFNSEAHDPNAPDVVRDELIP